MAMLEIKQNQIAVLFTRLDQNIVIFVCYCVKLNVQIIYFVL